MLEKARFIQGVYAFEGRGLEHPGPLSPELGCTVPRDRRAQLVYLRAGNSAAELIYLVLSQDEQPVRLFPIGAKTSMHVPLAIVENVPPETRLSLSLGAPRGLRGMLVIDLGWVEL